VGERADQHNTTQGEFAVGGTVTDKDVFEGTLELKKTPVLNTDDDNAFSFFCRQYWQKVLITHNNSHRLTTAH
jgi:hypothetical protein